MAELYITATGENIWTELENTSNELAVNIQHTSNWIYNNSNELAINIQHTSNWIYNNSNELAIDIQHTSNWIYNNSNELAIDIQNTSNWIYNNSNELAINIQHTSNYINQTDIRINTKIDGMIGKDSSGNVYFQNQNMLIATGDLNIYNTEGHWTQITPSGDLQVYHPVNPLLLNLGFGYWSVHGQLEAHEIKFNIISAEWAQYEIATDAKITAASGAAVVAATSTAVGISKIYTDEKLKDLVQLTEDNEVQIRIPPTSLFKYPREPVNNYNFTYSDNTNVRINETPFFSGGVKTPYNSWILFNSFLYYISPSFPYLFSPVNDEMISTNTISYFNSDSDFYGSYIILDLGEQILLDNYKIYPKNGGTAQAPLEWRVYATNDDASFNVPKSGNWVLLDERKNIDKWVDNNSKTFIVSGTSLYRYYAIIFHKIQKSNPENPSTGVLEMTEWELYGNPQNNNTRILIDTTTINNVLTEEGWGKWSNMGSYLQYQDIKAHQDKITIDYVAYTKYPKENLSILLPHTYEDGITIVDVLYETDGVVDFGYGWRLFDGNLSDFDRGWETDITLNPSTIANDINYVGSWVFLDLGEDINIYNYKLYPKNGYLQETPKAWKIYAANQSAEFYQSGIGIVNWDVIDNRTNVSDWANNTPKTFTITPTTKNYRYFLIVVAEANSTGIIRVMEWEIFGQEVKFKTLVDDLQLATEVEDLKTYVNGIAPNYVRRSLVSSVLQPSKVVATDVDGNLQTTSTSITQLSYLNDVTSSIQTQLDEKASYWHTHEIGEITNLIPTIGDIATASNLNTSNYVLSVNNNLQSQISGLNNNIISSVNNINQVLIPTSVAVVFNTLSNIGSWVQEGVDFLTTNNNNQNLNIVSYNEDIWYVFHKTPANNNTILESLGSYLVDGAKCDATITNINDNMITRIAGNTYKYAYDIADGVNEVNIDIFKNDTSKIKSLMVRWMTLFTFSIKIKWKAGTQYPLAIFRIADSASYSDVYYEFWYENNTFYLTIADYNKAHLIYDETAFTPNINEWYHIVITSSNSLGIKLYVNNQLLKTIGGSSLSMLSYFSLVPSPNLYCRVIEGAKNLVVEDCRIMNRFLSPEEIAKIQLGYEVYDISAQNLTAGDSIIIDGNSHINLDIEAGQGITTTLVPRGDGTMRHKISGNVYTDGNGLSIVNNVISADVSSNIIYDKTYSKHKDIYLFDDNIKIATSPPNTITSYLYYDFSEEVQVGQTTLTNKGTGGNISAILNNTDKLISKRTGHIATTNSYLFRTNDSLGQGTIVINQAALTALVGKNCLSVSFWMKHLDFTQNKTPLNLNFTITQSVSIVFLTNQTLRVSVVYDGILYQTIWNDSNINEFFHYVFIINHNGGNLIVQLYRDGVLQTPNSGGSFAIATFVFGAVHPFLSGNYCEIKNMSKSYLEEYRIFDRVLNTTEISQLYQPLPLTFKSLIDNDVLNASNLNTSNYVLSVNNNLQSQLSGLNNVSLATIGNVANASNLNTSNYVLSVNNNLQSQISGLNNVSLATVGNVANASNLNTSNYVLSVNNNLQTQINGKEPTIALGATQYALINTSGGKVGVSTVTATQLGYLSGVTSDIQTQINNKQNTLTAGTNISIATNTINCTAVSSQWTSGTGLIYYNGGNVGVGMNNPSKKLQVGINSQGSISIMGTGDARFHCYNGGAVQEWIWGQKSSTSHNWILSTLNSGTETDRFTVSTTGNVGVGTISPAYKLDVVGDINCTGNFKVNGVNLSTGSSQWTTNAGPPAHIQYGNVKVYSDQITVQGTPTLQKYPRQFITSANYTYTDGSGITVRVTQSTAYGGYEGFKLYDSSADYTGNFYCSSGNNYNNSTYIANDTTRYFNSDTTFYGEWVMVDLGESISLYKYEILPHNSTVLYSPKDFRIYATNDTNSWNNTKSGAWVQIDAKTNITSWAANTIYESILSLSTPYRFYAIIANKLYQAGSYLQFSRWKLYRATSSTTYALASTNDLSNTSNILQTQINAKQNTLVAGTNITIVGNTISSSGGGTSQWTTNGTSIYYNTGNVGVGIAAPAFKLDVAGDINASGRIIANQSIDGTSARGVYLWNSGDTNWGIYMGQSGAGRSLKNGTACNGVNFSSHSTRFRVYGSGGNNWGFIFENDNESCLMSIRSGDGMSYFAGNVGIKKSGAAYPLDVAGDINCTGTFRVNGTAFSGGGINYSHFNNMGVNHSTYTDFNLPPNFGFWFIQGGTNGPSTGSMNQYYCLNQGLGSDYPWTGAGNSYGMQLAIPRNQTTPYISIRFKEANSFGGWQKISAGNADSATQLNNPNKITITDEGTFRRIQTWASQPLSINPLGNNVGIGVTNPSQILHLKRTGADNYIKVDAGAGNANYSGIMLAEDGINYGYTMRYSAATDALIFSSQDNTPTFTDRMTLTYGGNLGVGITNPSYRVDVSGDINLTGTLRKNGLNMLSVILDFTYFNGSFNYRCDISSVPSVFVFGQTLRMFLVTVISSTDFGDTGNQVVGRYSVRVSDFAGLKWSLDSDYVNQNILAQPSGLTMINPTTLQISSPKNVSLKGMFISYV